jgi:hypothetical protein
MWFIPAKIHMWMCLISWVGTAAAFPIGSFLHRMWIPIIWYIFNGLMNFTPPKGKKLADIDWVD